MRSIIDFPPQNAVILPPDNPKGILRKEAPHAPHDLLDLAEIPFLHAFGVRGTINSVADHIGHQLVYIHCLTGLRRGSHDLSV